jgi:DNA-binding MarR family transcriptional regulator
MPVFDIYQRPGFLLRRAHQISTAIFERSCAHLGLTPAQYGVLSVLAEQPGVDQSSLARALAFDKVTVLRVLQGLEAKGLCTRGTSPGNRRQMAVELTPQGLELLHMARQPVQQAADLLLSPFTPAQREQFLGLLSTLNASLETEARAGFVPVQGQPLKADKPPISN